MIPNEIYSVEFELYPTSILIKKNHKIGLHISSSNWPRFDVNHNTGGSLGLDRDYIVAHQKVYQPLHYPAIGQTPNDAAKHHPVLQALLEVQQHAGVPSP